MTHPNQDVFSDEHRQNLKDRAWDYRDGHRFMFVKGPEILAVLARLDAAEAVLDSIDRSDGWTAQAEEFFFKWRKVAGK